jgi:hypothetical protein
MHGPINVKSPNNASKWQMGFNSAFKGLICYGIEQVTFRYATYPEGKIILNKIWNLLLIYLLTYLLSY